MTTRIADNQLKGIAYLLLFIVLFFIQLNSVKAQVRSASKKSYLGFSTSFGTRSFSLSSDIEKINRSQVNQAGGQVGLVYGNSVVRSRVGLLAYFSSGKEVAGSIDLLVNNASVNFYPLALIQTKLSKIQPYVNGGLSYDRLKFYGYYFDNDGGPVNYSTSQAPYLGAIKQINATVGAGLEFRIVENHTFLHFFSEVRYGLHVSDVSRDSEFVNTTTGNPVRLNLGVMFGSRK